MNFECYIALRANRPPDQRLDNGWRFNIHLLGEAGYLETHFEVQMTGEKKIDLKPTAKYLNEFARKILEVNRKDRKILKEQSTRDM